MQDQECLERLTCELFHFGPRELQKDGRLAPLRNVLMAAVLKDLTAMQADTGLQTDFFKVLIQSATLVGIKLSEMKEWGAKIKAHFDESNLSLANASGGGNNAAMEEAFRMMNASQLETKKQVQELRAENASLVSTVQKMETAVSTLTGTLEQFTRVMKQMGDSVDMVSQNVVSSPVKPRKRSRVSDADDTTTRDADDMTTSVANTEISVAKGPVARSSHVAAAAQVRAQSSSMVSTQVPGKPSHTNCLSANLYSLSIASLTSISGYTYSNSTDGDGAVLH